ncbi:SDR family NAD(P)-dependent oxidoreductase [archaeon]|jgi:UDP-N-acetylglucosamine 4,6-dehydratase/5-epimerase|nr:SDR family NAD(P)-dependent oxidoreductase [archaeon]MBT3451358.1 SDR family NAD(P)-dependent oxidoreductase [archaeon]MBT6869326.1 SDR family NAD(P)-dependent oxidoreductase [archaeon]MBT7192489.1 SDR family NAD(P)-dependent oxidoreductase [archaeon]MBT7380565.1 SDR family NAD(P)-dependent oxidoreductase [archaeon]
MEIFEGKTILITGGTGFLGRSLIRRILKHNPQAIRVFSRDEVKHYKVQQLFNNDERLRFLLGDVRDLDRLRRATQGCDIVIHAAALKRVDMIEYNVGESIKTNVIGTLNLVNACTENKVKKVIFISTDKACEPVNSYGACKFVSERIFVESNYSRGGPYPQFTCVRYGNVMQSTGSVIPFFAEKIKRQEKIPLTHAEMTRFIISANQAVDLVFDAIKYGIGGEIFVPKLPSFKVTQLINVLDKIYGHKSEIDLIGVRPGEKIHELMINSSEIPYTYEFKNNFVITSQIQDYINEKNAIYMLEGKKLNLIEMGDFCSKDTLVSDEEVSEIINNSLFRKN